MPKMKSNRSAAKRFTKKTASGRIRHKRAYKNHILTKKSAKRIRQLRADGQLSTGDEQRMKLILPYL